MSNLIDYRMGIQEAIEAPRFYARDTEEALADRGAVPAATLEALKKLGYSAGRARRFRSVLRRRAGHRARPEDEALTGGADPRRDGAVVVY